MHEACYVLQSGVVSVEPRDTTLSGFLSFFVCVLELGSTDTTCLLLSLSTQDIDHLPAVIVGQKADLTETECVIRSHLTLSLPSLSSFPISLPSFYASARLHVRIPSSPSITQSPITHSAIPFLSIHPTHTNTNSHQSSSSLREVPQEEAKQLAQEYKLAWIETSAKSNSNVALVFDMCLEEIEKSMHPGRYQGAGNGSANGTGGAGAALANATASADGKCIIM